MTAKLVIDVFYAAFTLADGTRQDITVRLREEGENWSQTSNLATLSRTTVGGESTYKTGYQSITDPSSPEYLAFEAYFRQNPQEKFDALMARIEAAFNGNLNSGSAWMEQWGLRVINGVDAGIVIPAS